MLQGTRMMNEDKTAFLTLLFTGIFSKFSGNFFFLTENQIN